MLPSGTIKYTATAADSVYGQGLNSFVLDGFEYKIEMPGVYSVCNAMAAIRIAQELGLSNQDIASALLAFKGVHRRFNIYNSQGAIYVDDYAHHPTEIKAAIQAAQSMFESKDIVVYFQPHLFSRTKDFMTGFAEALQMAKQVYLLDIYPAREEPIAGVTSSVLQSMVGGHCALIDEEKFHEALHAHANSSTVNLVMGAGSIGQFFQNFLTKEVSC